MNSSCSSIRRCARHDPEADTCWENRISPLLQTFTGENFNGYINRLRLDYSLVLLKDFKHYTIEAVAIDSGFGNVRTYQRIFRDKYGMTPMEYRKTQGKWRLCLMGVFFLRIFVSHNIEVVWKG